MFKSFWPRIAKHLEESFVSEENPEIYKEILFVTIIVKGMIS